MFLLGIVSLFQIIILPGLLFIKLLKIKVQSRIQSFLYTMGLSLYLNYLTACILTWQKLYTPTIVFTIFGLELITFFYLYVRGDIKLSAGRPLKEYYISLKDYLSKLPVLNRYAFVTACFLILFFISLVPLSIGTSYYFTDALLHWTRWPVWWASGNFPPDTNHYPQLFPTNLSLIYIFTGESGSQFFPKALMPFFFLGILLMFFDLAIWKRPLVHLTGLIIYALFLIIFFNILFILEVNADIPVAFFGFMAFYTILKQPKEGFDMETTLLVTIFASSAATTKLAGSYLLCLSILWIVYNFYINRKNIKKQELLKTGLYLLLVFCGSIFWYLVRPVDMVNGLDQSVYLVPDYYSRVIRAANMLFYSAGPVFFIFISLTLAAALFTKEARVLVIFIIIPASILWAFFFSTDFRALSFVIPFIAYASAYGLQHINSKLIKEQINKLPQDKSYQDLNKKKIIWAILITIIFALFVLSFTEFFISSGIMLANLINRYYFNGFRVVSTNEIGYYKFIEYYAGSLRIMCAILLVMFLLRYSRIRIWHFMIFFALIAIIANFTWLRRENIRQIVKNDAQMIDIHNLYYRIYSYVSVPGQKSRILTNSIDFNNLAAPPNTKFTLVNNTTYQTLSVQQKDNNCAFLLLDGAHINRETKELLNMKIKNREFSICFHDGEFMFFKLMK